MAYTVKHTPTGGAQATINTSVKWESLRLNLILTKAVSTCTFSVMNSTSHTIPAVGDTIDVYDGATHVFGGRITERNLILDGGLLSHYEYTVIDWTFDFDKKNVIKTYTATDPGTIVLDIVSSFTTGYTTANVALAGYTIPSIAFNYQPPSKALQKICSLIGYQWYIDADKDVHFFSSSVKPAPFNLSDTAGNHVYSSLVYDTSIQNLKNSVFVIGGDYKKNYTALTTPDTYLTDGTAQVFPLAYSYDPTTIGVTLAGVAQTIGIDQVNSFPTYQVLYNAGTNGRGAFIRFNGPPAGAQTLKIFGDALIPVLGHAIDSASVATYGEFQDSIVDKLITTVAEAQKRAQAEIALYGTPSYTISFSTLTSGLMVGQTITLASTLLGITKTFTIKNIRISANSPTAFFYEVSAEATDVITFTDIMTLLLENELNANAVDSSTILQVLLTFAESLAITDTAFTSSTSGPYNWDGASSKWNFSVWG